MTMFRRFQKRIGIHIHANNFTKIEAIVNEEVFIYLDHKALHPLFHQPNVYERNDLLRKALLGSEML